MIKLHHFVYVALMFIAGVCVQWIYWQILPLDRDVFKFNKPIEVRPNRSDGLVERDSYVEVVMDYCKRPGLEPAAVFISFEDDFRIDVAGYSYAVIPDGCHVITIYEHVPILPEAKHPYRMVMSRNYHINPVRTVVVTSKSNDFKMAESQDALETKIDELNQRVQDAIDRAYGELRRERQRALKNDHAGNFK